MAVTTFQCHVERVIGRVTNGDGHPARARARGDAGLICVGFGVLYFFSLGFQNPDRVVLRASNAYNKQQHVCTVRV